MVGKCTIYGIAHWKKGVKKNQWLAACMKNGTGNGTENCARQHHSSIRNNLA